MQQSSLLDGYLYHMIHFDNLRSIFRHGALFSKKMLELKGIEPRSIAYQSVQDLRDRIFLWHFTEQQYHNLHKYVPLYFAPRPPMQYVSHIASIQDQLVILVFNRTILQGKDVLFTDGNATNQQLSHFDEQYVRITPIRDRGNQCRREYHPDNQPHGTNTNRTNFYGNIDLLDLLDWDVIFDRPGRRFIDDRGEYTRIRSAEVLVPDQLSLEYVAEIAVRTREMISAVKALIAGYNLVEIPSISFKPFLFT